MNSKPLLDREATENEEFVANKLLEKYKYGDNLLKSGQKLNYFLNVSPSQCAELTDLTLG